MTRNIAFPKLRPVLLLTTCEREREREGGEEGSSVIISAVAA
jgi:hypothetical protein